MITHTISSSVSSSNGSRSIKGTQEESGSNEININKSFAAGSTNVVLAIAFNYADLQDLCLLSTKDMTLEFNNSTTGVPAINLVAGAMWFWNKSSGDPNPFTANVTTCFVTCAAAATLTGKGLVA